MDWIMLMNTHFIKLFGINMLDCGFLDPKNNISANRKVIVDLLGFNIFNVEIWQQFISQSPRIFLSPGMLRLYLQELAGEDFESSEGSGNGEILCVSPVFRTARMDQKIHLPAAEDLFRVP